MTTLNEQTIFEHLRVHILNIFPNLADTSINFEDSLKALGANSMDRAEIIIETLAALDLRVPMVQFGQAKNIGEIVAIMEKAMGETQIDKTSV